jgi:hypothetical protein
VQLRCFVGNLRATRGSVRLVPTRCPFVGTPPPGFTGEEVAMVKLFVPQRLSDC